MVKTQLNGCNDAQRSNRMTVIKRTFFAFAFYFSWKTKIKQRPGPLGNAICKSAAEKDDDHHLHLGMQPETRGVVEEGEETPAIYVR